MDCAATPALLARRASVLFAGEGDAVEEISISGAIVGGLAAFALGGVWYSKALFGSQWMEAAGLDEARLASADMVRLLAITVPLSLLAAFVFAAFLGMAGVGFGTAVGFAAGLCWVTASLGINYAFEQRPLKLLLVNGGYHTLQFTLYGFCIGAANSWF
jgi:hypothetical protein